jgi:hypothetical protein
VRRSCVRKESSGPLPNFEDVELGLDIVRVRERQQRSVPERARPDFRPPLDHPDDAALSEDRSHRRMINFRRFPLSRHRIEVIPIKDVRACPARKLLMNSLADYCAYSLTIRRFLDYICRRRQGFQKCTAAQLGCSALEK